MHRIAAVVPFGARGKNSIWQAVVKNVRVGSRNRTLITLITENLVSGWGLN